MFKRIPKWLKVSLQALVSLGLIVFVLRQIDLTQVKTLVLQPPEPVWLIAALPLALLLFNASKIASALRLNIYQRHAAIHLEEWANLRLYYAGMFLNLFLPGGISGDGYKVLVLNRKLAAPIKTLLMIALADRLSGLLILLLLLCLLVPVLPLPDALPAALSFSSGVWTALAAVGATLLAVAFLILHAGMLKLKGTRMIPVFAYSLAVQLLQLACLALLLLYLQVQPAHYLTYLAVFLVSSVAAVLPLSIGGLGAREVTFLYGMSLFHLDPTQGVVASSGFFLITLVSSLLGVLFLGRELPASTPTTINGKTV